MKNLLILLITTLAFSLNSASAGIVNCDSVDNKISKYPVYQNKIDTIFQNIFSKDESIQEKFHAKIKTVTEQYLSKTQDGSKLHTIIGYLYCENNKNRSADKHFNKTTYNLENVLGTIKKSASAYKYTTVVERKGKVFFEGPRHVVGSEIHYISLNDLKGITGIQNLLFSSLSQVYNGSLGLHSAYIEGKYLFLELQANQAGGYYSFYLVMNKNGQLKDFRGIDKVGDQTILWERENSLTSTSHILGIERSDFTYIKSINNLQWRVSNDHSSELVIINDGVGKYGLIGNDSVYDFENKKLISLEEDHNLIFFGTGLNTLSYNHDEYSIISGGKTSNKCGIQTIQYSDNSKKIVYGKTKNGFCGGSLFSYNFKETFDQAHGEYNVREYYNLIEQGMLEAAFERKLFNRGEGEKDSDFSKRYALEKQKFITTYSFEKDVEINLNNFKKLDDLIYSFNVTIIYSVDRRETYLVSMKIWTGMIPQLETISVKKQ